MTKPRVGQPGEPEAEKTQLGSTIISPGCESEGLSNMLLTRNWTCDHDQLSRLDVLGIEDQPSGDQEFVCQEFKDRLQRNPGGSYETSLIWTVGHPTQDNNTAGSLLHLKSLLGKLKKDPEIFEQYDNIIKEQLAEGIIERVTSNQMIKNSIFHISLLSRERQKVRKWE